MFIQLNKRIRTMKYILIALAMTFSVVATAQKEKPAKGGKATAGKGTQKGAALATHQDSLAYALGVSMFQTTSQSGLGEFDFDLFVKGMEGQRSGAPILDAEAADDIIRSEMKRKAEEMNTRNKKEGEAFLEANKSRPGIQTTSTGLQYRVEVEGKGVRPDANDKVTVHYHGTLTDGSVFDSSVNRGKPATFGLNQVITGWTEGVQLMTEGSKYTFFVPQHLAYGARAQGKILPYSTLIFEVELISVEPVN
jgi:FKBP-type peptidyl-prolyl cis-trans isomerase